MKKRKFTFGGRMVRVKKEDLPEDAVIVTQQEWRKLMKDPAFCCEGKYFVKVRAKGDKA